MESHATMDDAERLAFFSAVEPSAIRHLFDVCPFRKHEITRLLQLLGRRNETASSSVFVYGHSGTGKTHVIKNIMDTLEIPHCFINSVETYSPRLLFEAILHACNKIFNTKEIDFVKCDHMNDFINLLRKQKNYWTEPLYIIIDGAERLRYMDSNILAGFLRLGSLIEANICMILVTEVIWEKFLINTAFQMPSIVHFNDYNRDSLIGIMSIDCPNDYSKDFYQTYCKLVLGVLHIVCRELSELRHLALSHFSEYCRPIRDGESQLNDVRKLWRNIEPHLKKALHSVYQEEYISNRSSQSEKQDQNGSLANSINKIELPYYSKYLLIASYLASFNPVRTDRRYFSKTGSGKMSKQAKRIAKKKQEKTYQGPKAFTLDRMLAIFYSIVEGGATPSANILTQITSLVALNFLIRSSAESQIDAPKYRCIVSFSFIQSIAKTLNCDLAQYLHDA